MHFSAWWHLLKAKSRAEWTLEKSKFWNWRPNVTWTWVTCPHVEDLNVTGSFGITNLGVQWFCTGTYNPNHLFHGAPDNRKVLLQDPSTRIGFQPTPIIQFGQTIASKGVKKGQILKSLRRADFGGTSIDSKALELVLSHCKMLQKLVVDDEVWTMFFNLFEINDEKGTKPMLSFKFLQIESFQIKICALWKSHI